MMRLAVIVSHPIQYFVPLYERLACRSDLALKVFFTWHAGEQPVEDRGFGSRIAWDIPLTRGYAFELVPNISADPGTHRFSGLRNPSLVGRVLAWRPDVVVIHGWAWLSHLRALRALHRHGVRTLFRGDSHLLDNAGYRPRRLIKRAILRHIFSWPDGFLVVGAANRDYYRQFGVEPARLCECPHSIDVGRFAEPAEAFESEAARWRLELGIAPEQPVLLYAGKFEPGKRPVELMQTVQRMKNRDAVLVLVGGGELHGRIEALAATDPGRFRVLPLQNQRRMPVVYRLGDLCVLPSAHETWGLAVNEALACGRPVLVSDRVGCAADVVDPSCGRIFPWGDLPALAELMDELTGDPAMLHRMRRGAAERARNFDIAVTEARVMAAVERYGAG